MPASQFLFTDRPRGKGFNSSRLGYQIAASSEGLNDELRQQLAAVANHYGDAVRLHAPLAAHEAERQWRKEITQEDPVPAHILEQFPVAWNYTRLGDGRFAMMRTCYTGRVSDGRFGNFLSHALVLSPDELVPLGSDPLALLDRGLFKTEDDPSVTVLPELRGLGGAAVAPVDWAAVQGEPWQGRLPGMVSALAAASATTRPLVLCLPGWRQAPAVCRALLGLLPPSARRKTTFATFESDPSWVSAGRQRTADQAAEHCLVVLCDRGDKRFRLEPKDYEAAFAVFNFVENRFSELGEPTPYAQFAAECVQQGRTSLLAALHELIEDLGLGENPGHWDRLLPAAPLLEKPPDKDALGEAAKALNGFGDDIPADKPFALIAPLFLECARYEDLARMKPTAPALGEMLDRLAIAAPQQSEDFAVQVAGLAGSALSRGRWDVADVELAACGEKRSEILCQLLTREEGPFRAPKGPESPASQLAMLAEGVRTVAEWGMPPENVLHLAGKALDALFASGGADHFWAQAGESVIVPALESGTGAPSLEAVEDLLARVPASAAPSANLALRLLRLRASGWAPDALRAEVVALAKACGRSADFEKAKSRLLDALRSACPAPEDFAEMAGVAANAAAKTPQAAAWQKEHLSSMERLDDRQTAEVRSRFAKHGFTNLLALEFMRDVLPWDEGAGAAKVGEWGRIWFRNNRNLLVAALRTVARRLANLERTEQKRREFLPLVAALVEAASEEDASVPGLPGLCGAVAELLPIFPAEKDRHSQKTWAAFLGILAKGMKAPPPAPDGKPDKGFKRILVKDLVREGEEAASHGAPWRAKAFPCNHPGLEWMRDLLPVAEKEAAQQWLERVLGSAEIADGADAAAACGALKKAYYEKHKVGLALAKMFEGDEDRCLAALKALCDLPAGAGAPGSSEVETRGEIVQSMLWNLNSRAMIKKVKSHLKEEKDRLGLEATQEAPERRAVLQRLETSAKLDALLNARRIWSDVARRLSRFIKRHPLHLIAGVLCVMMLFLAITLRAERTEAAQTFAQMAGSINLLAADLEHARGELDSMRGFRDQFMVGLGKARGDLDRVREKRDSLRVELDKVRSELAAAKRSQSLLLSAVVAMDHGLWGEAAEAWGELADNPEPALADFARRLEREARWTHEDEEEATHESRQPFDPF